MKTIMMDDGDRDDDFDNDGDDDNDGDVYYCRSIKGIRISKSVQWWQIALRLPSLTINCMSSITCTNIGLAELMSSKIRSKIF